MSKLKPEYRAIRPYLGSRECRRCTGKLGTLFRTRAYFAGPGFGTQAGKLEKDLTGFLKPVRSGCKISLGNRLEIEYAVWIRTSWRGCKPGVH